MQTWIQKELAGSVFTDERLTKRFGKLVEQLSAGLGRSLPLACADWAATKAAYRFLSNPRVSEDQILAGHFQATCQRFTATQGTIPIAHDTTEFSFHRQTPSAIGKTHRCHTGKDKTGRPCFHTVSGVLMHSSLAMTEEGLPLGLASVRYWTRKKIQRHQCPQT